MFSVKLLGIIKWLTKIGAGVFGSWLKTLLNPNFILFIS